MVAFIKQSSISYRSKIKNLLNLNYLRMLLYRCKNYLKFLNKYNQMVWSKLVQNLEKWLLFLYYMKLQRNLSKHSIINNQNPVQFKASSWLEEIINQLRKFTSSWGLIVGLLLEISSHPDTVKKVSYQCFGLKSICLLLSLEWLLMLSLTQTLFLVEWLLVCLSKVWQQNQ